MGIGSVEITAKGDDPAVGCYVQDTHGGCGIEMWDNETDSNISMNISVSTGTLHSGTI